MRLFVVLYSLVLMCIFWWHAVDSFFKWYGSKSEGNFKNKKLFLLIANTALTFFSGAVAITAYNTLGQS